MKIEAMTGMQAIKKLVMLNEFLFFHTHIHTHAARCAFEENVKPQLHNMWCLL